MTKRKQLQASFIDGVWLMGMAVCSVIVLLMILAAKILRLVLAEDFMVEGVHCFLIPLFLSALMTVSICTVSLARALRLKNTQQMHHKYSIILNIPDLLLPHGNRPSS